jgi:hypothetical protein
MITAYLTLKIGALLLTMLLPIAGPAKKPKRPYIALSDWGINEKGLLVDLTEQHPGNHPIKLKH